MDTQLTQSRFASVLMILAGAWLLISPIWISITGGALTSLMITGGIITLAGLVQYFWKVSVPSWVAGLAAVWLLVSTFVFDVSTAVVWNQIVMAVVAMIIAYWDGFEMTQSQHHHTSHNVM